MKHISNRKSNKALQNAFDKYALYKFNFCIYEYYTYDNKTVKGGALTKLETSYIKNFYTFYNFMKTATSLTRYKHTVQAGIKRVKIFKNESNQPVFEKSNN